MRLRCVLAALSVAAVVVTGAGVPTSAVGAGLSLGAVGEDGASVRAARALPADIEEFVPYDGQLVCDPRPKPGAVRLARIMQSEYGSFGASISRDCGDGDRSEHKEGRAVDWSANVRIPKERRAAEAFIDWLLATDAAGNRAAVARRLGVMYIGWDDRIWASYRDGTWSSLHDCLHNPAKAGPAFDSDCHRNHVHVSLSWDGAAARTSYWTGKVLPPACDPGWGYEPDPQVPVPAQGRTVVFDSGTGTGSPGTTPCRLAPAQNPLTVVMTDPAAPPQPPADADPYCDPDSPWYDPDDPYCAGQSTNPTPAAGAPGGYDVTVRIEKASSTSPAAVLLLGRTRTRRADVAVELPVRKPRTVTVHIRSDRSLVLGVNTGVATARVTVTAVTPVD